MRRKTFFKIVTATTLCICSLFSLQVQAQLNFKWGKQFNAAIKGGSSALAADKLGNIYLVGSISGATTASDAYVSKVDSMGNLIWTKQFSTTADENFNGVAIDSLGNIYAAGYTKGVIGDSLYGAEDIVVVKLSTEGTILWKKQIGSTTKDVAYSILIPSNGGVYIGGETNGKLGDAALGGIDGFVIKLNSNGDKIYTYQFGTINNEICMAMESDKKSSIYATGWTAGPIGAVAFGSRDVYVLKFNDNVKPIRKIQYGSSATEEGRAIAVDSLGNIYVGGSTYGSIGGVQLGQGDSHISKLDSTGSILWSRQFGTTGWDGIHSIVISKKADDQVIVSGCQSWPACQSFIKIFKPDGKLLLVSESVNNLIKGGTCGQKICQDQSGNLYHNGNTSETLFGQIAGTQDYYLMKLSSSTQLTKVYINKQIQNQTGIKGQLFSFKLPDNTFVTADGNSEITFNALLSNGNALPQWLSFDPSTATFSGTPPEMGTLTINVIASDKSMSKTSCSFFLNIDKATGNSTLKSNYESPLKVYPNPSNGKIKIDFGNMEYAKAKVKVCDVSGNTVFVDYPINKSKIIIDISNQPKGVYLLGIVIDNEVIRETLVLK